MRLLSLFVFLAGVATAQKTAFNHSKSDWITHGNNHAGWRFSELDQINSANVKQLSPQWIYQTGTPGRNESTPIVWDRTLYVTGPGNAAYAINAHTGRPLWRYAKPVPKEAIGCCGQMNRGFAMLDEVVYKVNYQATLVALDRKTGRELWETEIGDIKQGLTTTAAPLVVKDKVIVGIAGAEFGVRGFLDAYDAKTGKRAWRFYTVAGPDDPGGKTWGGESWMRGGGSTWVTGTYDPETNLIYWGTGNPGPDMNGDVRPGDNLYTCSLVAVDADTGKLKWHFQFTPHDVHDWDATEDPVLIDMNVKGKPVKAVVMANRNGFFYALDRTNGKLLHAKAYTKVTWADGIGADGRPNLVSGQDPTEDGNKSCPGLGGGHNWQPTAYSPRTGLYYFPTTEGCHLFFKLEQKFVEGQWYQGSTATSIPTEPNTGAVVAIDPATGETKWKFPMYTSPSAGILATAGNLVFSGDNDGYLFALDGATGKPLWRFQTGGPIATAPVSYLLDGKQYIAVTSGASVITFALP